jgi:hypothetical protein
MGKPEISFKCGSCETAVFENKITKDGKKITMKKIAFQKRYKSSKGDWKTTYSLDTNDIPKAILALSKAYEYLILSDSNKANENELKA